LIFSLKFNISLIVIDGDKPVTPLPIANILISAPRVIYAGNSTVIF